MDTVQGDASLLEFLFFVLLMLVINISGEDGKPQDQSPDPKEAYAIVKRWYFHASARKTKPPRADQAKVSGDYAALY